jgi:hypothetical protein|uniref:Uncharacterized protein n=1 Tax=viral metagenome TaxID=1070528 RepID=A0A6C0B1C2_9ZZZZ
MSKKRGGGSSVLDALMYLAYISIPIGAFLYIGFAIYDAVNPSHS